MKEKNLVFKTKLNTPTKEKPKPLSVLKLWFLLIELITGQGIKLFTLLAMHKEI